MARDEDNIIVHVTNHQGDERSGVIGHTSTMYT